MKIVVSGWIPEAAVADLEATGAEVVVAPEDLRAAVAGADALVALLGDRVDGALLDAAGERLEVVANVAVGFDNIDRAACAERGVVVTNTPGVLVDATADLALALLLAVTRRLGEGERLVRSGAPWQWDMKLLLGTELRGRTLGVVGLGAIGAATARRARAFGMDIIYTQRHRADAALEAELGGARLLPLDDLLAASDALTLHCPLTPETHHLIDARALALLPRHAVLVNTARGPVVDEAALVDALRSGALAGAGLDVYEHEPEVHPGLRELDNVHLLPHLGSATVETRTAMARLAARNVAAVLRGEAPPTPVAYQASA